MSSPPDPASSCPGKQILLATGNPGKVREILDVLGDLPATLRRLSEFPDLPEAVESANTFEENAASKAMHYANLTGIVTLAEDSGIEIDALGGAPGVYSARFAGRHGDDAANNAKVIQLLAGVAEPQRTGRFRCVCVLASADRVIATGEGTIEGRILDELRGSGGFGYDPLFYVPQLGCTTAQLTRQAKNRISHRGKALRAIRPRIQEWLRQGPEVLP
jgi:XTP/dITP diphosphohydrolase